MEPKITLIGLGNILLRDEGVGVHAVRYLEAHYESPPGLEVVDGGTSGLDLLPYIENRDRVLIVDAVNFRKEPGYIGVLKNQEVPALFALKDSLHHLGLMDVLAAAQLLGRRCSNRAPWMPGAMISGRCSTPWWQAPVRPRTSTNASAAP